jgi:hypothetical protein
VQAGKGTKGKFKMGSCGVHYFEALAQLIKTSIKSEVPHMVLKKMLEIMGDCIYIKALFFMYLIDFCNQIYDKIRIS